MPDPISTTTAPPGVPVVRRADGRLQVGSSPRSASLHVLAAPVPVEGAPRRTGVLADHPDEALAWAAYDRGGASPGRRLSERARASVAAVGSPAVVDVLLHTLAGAGVGRLLCDRPGPLVSRAGGPADVLVLVDDHVARPVLADGVQADGVPHLSVVLRDTDAVVGPFVVPGRSACLRCLDRAHSDADPGWPHLRDALTGAGRRPVDAATAHAVAGIAALQVLTHLDGGRPATVGTTLELLLPEGRMRHRWWLPHPDCGCVELPVPVRP
ncbi:hypothetical protein [Kineococcus sp. SYSU DK003]|uniref:hypothetical protein n=1 Tax=Kineococcus sp. SYSU DK003 TaxID=3383124 RepID=UPI003D7E3897